MELKIILTSALVGALAFMSLAGASAQDGFARPDWREQYAYTLGVQAYIFGFPYVYLSTLRADWVTRPKSANELPLYAPINHFSHVRTLADASYRGGASPNEDTLYSTAWLDVGKEPVIVRRHSLSPWSVSGRRIAGTEINRHTL